MTFVDLFAGVGGFRRGLESVGHKCIGFCEWDKYAVASYTSMHLLTDEQRETLAKLPLKKRQKEILKEEYRNGEWYAKDIRDVTGDSIPKCDMWCFGAPCQDFSIAGLRAGLSGDRSSLVREVFRILSEQEECDRPEWLLYENVKGMLSSNGGKDYLSILIQMDELGYDAQWFVFNSKFHGVPQNRERVYTIGHLRCRNGSKILSFGRTNKKNSLEEINPECVGGIGEKLSNNNSQYYQSRRIYDGEKVATSLCSQLPGGANYYTINQIGKLGDANRDNPNRFRVYDPNGIGASLDSGIGGGRGGHTIIPIDVESEISPSQEHTETVDYPSINQIGKLGDANRDNPSRFRVYGPDGVGASLTTMGGGGVEPYTVEKIDVMSKTETPSQEQIKVANYPFGNQKSDIFSPEGISRTLAASDYKQPLSVVIPFGIDKGVEGEERDVANALTAREDRGVSNHKQEGTAVAVPIELSPLSDTEDVSPFMYDDYNSKFRDDNIAGTLTPNTGCKTARTGQKVCIPVLTPDRIEKRQNGRRFKEDGEPSFTLTAQDKHGVAIGMDISQNIEVEGNYMPSGHEAGNIISPNGIAPTVKENHGTIQSIPIPIGVLRNVRSDYGKEIRKDYEAGNLDVSRHEFLEKEIREDGVTNTLDSVPHDNLVAVNVTQDPKVLGNAYPSGGENGNVYDENSVSPTLKAGEGVTGNGIGSCNAPKVALNTKSLGIDLKGGYPNSTRGGVIKEEMVGALDHNCYVGVGQPIEGTNDSQEPISINIKEATTKGYAEAYEGDSINLEMPESETRRGRVGHQVAQTLTTSCNQGIIVAIDAEKPGEEHPGLYIQLAEDCIVYAIWYEKYQCYIAIRKLIPKECFRLQGWSDEYFERAAFVNTDTQLYKQAGNGVSVPVVEVVGDAINNYYLD